MVIKGNHYHYHYHYHNQWWWWRLCNELRNVNYEIEITLQLLLINELKEKIIKNKIKKFVAKNEKPQNQNKMKNWLLINGFVN